MNRSSTRLQIAARAASLALVAVLLAPAAVHADALPLRIADPTANEKLASEIFLSLGGGNVKRSLSLAAKKRWGNDYMHARYYSPNLGRFLSVDPVGGSVGSSQSWNRYSYVWNNPLGFVDPTGKYGRGSGFTDKQWETFKRTQQDAAKKMEKRAQKLAEKADKREAKGKEGAGDLRLNANNLREGAKALRSDGSDGLMANALSKADYAQLPDTTEHGAAVSMIGGPEIALNIDHYLWGSSGLDAQRALGHESLHTAGLRDQYGTKFPVKAYQFGPQVNRKAFSELIGTPKALINPDHIMDLVY